MPLSSEQTPTPSSQPQVFQPVSKPLHSGINVNAAPFQSMQAVGLNLSTPPSPNSPPQSLSLHSASVLFFMLCKGPFAKNTSLHYIPLVFYVNKCYADTFDCSAHVLHLLQCFTHDAVFFLTTLDLRLISFHCPTSSVFTCKNAFCVNGP